MQDAFEFPAAECAFERARGWTSLPCHHLPPDQGHSAAQCPRISHQLGPLDILTQKEVETEHPQSQKLQLAGRIQLLFFPSSFKPSQHCNSTTDTSVNLSSLQTVTLSKKHRGTKLKTRHTCMKTQSNSQALLCFSLLRRHCKASTRPKPVHSKTYFTQDNCSYLTAAAAEHMENKDNEHGSPTRK